MSQEHPRERYVDPNLEMLQRVEGGGPLKAFRLKKMPRWLRWFGTFFLSVYLVILVCGLFLSVMK